MNYVTKTFAEEIILSVMEIEEHISRRELVSRSMPLLSRFYSQSVSAFGSAIIGLEKNARFSRGWNKEEGEFFVKFADGLERCKDRALFFPEEENDKWLW